MYNFIRIILYFFIFPIVIIKREFFFKRITFNKEKIENKIDKKKEYVWFNIASVGEVNVAEETINNFLKKTQYNIFITIMTDTGYDICNKKFGDNSRITIAYFPLDIKSIIKKMCKLIKPKLTILVETEIWPNLIMETAKYGNVVIINGRISDKTLKSYLKFSFLFREAFSKISLFLIQTEEDKNRFVAIGASEEKCKVLGNLKFDIKVQEYTVQEKEELKKQLLISDKLKILVAGSTHPLEEEFILNSIDLEKDIVVFLVPRHLQRIAEVQDLLDKKAIKYNIWDKENKIEKSEKFIIVNQMGVLRKLYSIADFVFVGGTIAKVGGHSLLEPLKYQKMPIFGPNIANVKDISKEILKREIGYKISTEKEFADAVGAIQKVDEQLSYQKIERFFSENKDVAEKTFTELEKYIY